MISTDINSIGILFYEITYQSVGGKTVFSKQTTADFYVSDHGVITENIKDPCSIVIPMKNNHLREGNGLT